MENFQLMIDFLDELIKHDDVLNKEFYSKRINIHRVIGMVDATAEAITAEKKVVQNMQQVRDQLANVPEWKKKYIGAFIAA